MEVGQAWICRGQRTKSQQQYEIHKWREPSTTVSTVGSQREQDDAIGYKQQREDYDADKPTVGHHQKAKDTSVSASQL